MRSCPLLRSTFTRASLHGYGAAGDWQVGARDEAAFVGRREQNGRGNLFGPSKPLHWRHGDEPVLHRADVQAELRIEKGVSTGPGLTMLARDQVAAISTYLWAVADEASARGYKFDVSKIAKRRAAVSILVTRGQLHFELEHLRSKLRARDRERLRALRGARVQPHPMLQVINGGIEPWEVV